MTDEELIAKLKGTAPKEPADPELWASIEAGVRAGIAGPAPRRLPWRSMIGVGLAAAAALALFLHLRGPGTRVATHVPGHRPVDESILLPDEDPTELVGDLDLDELKTVEHHFKGGV